MQSSQINGHAQREDLTGATSAGAWEKFFPSFSRRTHGPRTLSVAPLGIICTQGGDEKEAGDYLGELLECIVMQSRCHSTFTFQASEEECVHVWKLASYTWLEATGSRLHPGCKNERPLTSRTGWASIKFCPRTPSYCLSQARERQQEERFLHREGEVGPEVDVPFCPGAPQHLFLRQSAALWRRGRAQGWIMCEPYCSSSQRSIWIRVGR